MARIRLGDAGLSVAPLPARRMPIDALRDDSGAVLGQTAQAVAAGLLRDERAEQKRIELEAEQEQKLQERELRRARGEAAYVSFQDQAKQIVESFGTQLAEKKITRDEVPERVAKELRKQRDALLEGLDPGQKAVIDAHFGHAESNALAVMRKLLALDAKQERAATVLGMGETLQRLGLGDPAGAIQQHNVLLDNEGPGLFGADKVAGMKQAFSERVYASHFANRIATAHTSAKALEQLEGEITANDRLDPDRRASLLSHVMSLQETLQAKAERARQSRLHSIERELEGAFNTAVQGYEVKPTVMDALLTSAKGTELAPMARFVVTMNTELAKFRAAPPQVRERMRMETEARVRENPTKWNVKVLDGMRQVDENLEKGAKEDPMFFAHAKGLANLPPLDIMQPANLASQFAGRLDIARGMKAQYGSPLRLLTKDEAANLSRFLADGTTDTKAQILARLRDTVRDPEAYGAIMGQIAPDSPVTAAAGAILGKEGSTVVQPAWWGRSVRQSPREIASVMLEGETALNRSKEVKAQDGKISSRGLFGPPDEKLKAAFDDAIGKAFATDQGGAETAFQAVRAYYVGSAIRDGELWDKDRGIDSDRMSRALRAVVGEVVNFNSRGEVRLPWGMDEGTFNDRVRKRFPEAVTAAGLPEATATMLPALGLVQKGEGRYQLRSGTGWLLGKNGRPVEIDVNDSLFRDALGRQVSKQIPQ